MEAGEVQADQPPKLGQVFCSCSLVNTLLLTLTFWAKHPESTPSMHFSCPAYSKWGWSKRKAVDIKIRTSLWVSKEKVDCHYPKSSSCWQWTRGVLEIWLKCLGRDLGRTDPSSFKHLPTNRCSKTLLQSASSSWMCGNIMYSYNTFSDVSMHESVHNKNMKCTLCQISTQPNLSSKQCETTMTDKTNA